MLFFEALRAPSERAESEDVWKHKISGGQRGFRLTPRALAKFGRPKNACVFEGGRIWLSPHGRARRRAQLARAKPEAAPKWAAVALTRLLSDGGPGSCLIYQKL